MFKILMRDDWLAISTRRKNEDENAEVSLLSSSMSDSKWNFFTLRVSYFFSYLFEVWSVFDDEYSRNSSSKNFKDKHFLVCLIYIIQLPSRYLHVILCLYDFLFEETDSSFSNVAFFSESLIRLNFWWAGWEEREEEKRREKWLLSSLKHELKLFILIFFFEACCALKSLLSWDLRFEDYAKWIKKHSSKHKEIRERLNFDFCELEVFFILFFYRFCFIDEFCDYDSNNEIFIFLSNSFSFFFSFVIAFVCVRLQQSFKESCELEKNWELIKLLYIFNLRAECSFQYLRHHETISEAFFFSSFSSIW